MRDPERVRRSPEECDVTEWLGRGQQQEAAVIRCERVRALAERRLDALRHVARDRETEATGELCGRHTAGQFQQRERIAVDVGDDRVSYAIIDRTREHGTEQ